MFLLLILIGAIFSFSLDESTRAVFTCDYSSPTAIMRVGNAGLPCSSMYTPALVSNGLAATTNATSILDSDTILPVKGFKCFKLILVTRCIQRWFVSNDISRFTITQDVSRDECMSGSTCIGCEVANEYSPEDCRVFTFGQNDVRKPVIFKSSVMVSVDKLGRYYFGDLISSSGIFDLGGDYKTRVFHEFYDVSGFESIEEYYFNKEKMVLVSLKHKRLYNWGGTEVNFNDKLWLVFDKNNMVLKSDLVLGGRSLSVQKDPKQMYYDFFLSAQLNVTNWKLDYLDCRLKNIAVSENNANVLDLGVGEIYLNESIMRYPCKSISIGDVIGYSGCLVLDLAGDVFRIKSNGEASVLSDVCSRSLRLNRTHVLNLNSDGVVELVVYSYPSLQEEESILNHPPSVVFDKSEIISLIKASSVYDKTSRSSGSIQTLTNGVQDDGKGTFARFFGSLTLNIVYFITSILVFGHLLYLGLRSYFPDFSIKKREQLVPNDNSNKSFELKI
jgi:hypothetical protein